MRRAVLLSALGGAENTTLRCGLTLHETRRTGIHSHVELREYELQDGKLKIAATLASGWLASMDLSASVERHFYHIELTGPAPTSGHGLPKASTISNVTGFRFRRIPDE
ncbi:MAG: hypothetical protein JWQ02_947 [Capsulimonas sp.]|nr:hypothetical protein [Capsulimonas sp.]